MRPIDADEYVKEIKRCEYIAKVYMKDVIDPNLDHEIFTEREYWNGVLGTFAEAMDVADNMPTIGGWISVEERLPETRHAVLVYTPHYKNIWAASMHEDGNWYIWSPGNRVLLDPDWYGPITHWMPLPPEPEVSKDAD